MSETKQSLGNLVREIVKHFRFLVQISESNKKIQGKTLTQEYYNLQLGNNISSLQYYNLIKLYLDNLLSAEDVLPYIKRFQRVESNQLLIDALEKSKPFFLQLVEQYEIARGWK